MKKTIQHATLFDVAREARVGTSTVSRVIKGGARVSPDTLERVRAIIRKLGYHPNKAAQILKGERTKIIGLVAPNISNPFFALCVEAAQDISRTHGFLLIMTCSNDIPSVELDDINALLQRQVEGILLVPVATCNNELVQILSQTPIPVVSFDRPIHNSSVPSVVSTNYKGSKEATRHLISHGCKHIVCLAMKGDESLYTSKERIRGYRIAMQEAHLMPRIDFSCTTQESTELALKSYLCEANPPDAIFAIRNHVTIFAFEALHKLHVRIPETIALVGFDDFQLASSLEPSITVVKQEIEQMGKMAAMLLFDQILKRQSTSRVTGKSCNSGNLWLQTELIVRNSCGCHKEELKN
jgi:LacI family transcriptional regulator